MKKTTPPLIDLTGADARLRVWREKYNTPTKVAAAHRKVLLDRVVESMAFDEQPVSRARLKILLKDRKPTGE
jgi:hypothetical protein